ncbi:MAG: hypothetical protein K0R54_611 [Clostridiaceae bacterium]|jgi:hypothetical protein|nr:hypothetical protein [Clostridiaceae bacterium]
MTTKKFDLRLERAKKILYATVQGNFGPEDCNGFVTDYNQNVKSVNAKEYELKFDCTKLGVTGKSATTGVNMTEMLQGCLDMYKKDGFASVVFDCTGNAIMAMQLNRLGKQVGLPNFKVIS